MLGPGTGGRQGGRMQGRILTQPLVLRRQGRKPSIFATNSMHAVVGRDSGEVSRGE